MNFINKKILIIIFLLLINVTSKISANSIIFKLNKSIYTSEDLEKRITYIKLKDKILNINQDQIKNEYINALIFNEFGNTKIEIQDSLVLNYYNEFFDKYTNIKKKDLLYNNYQLITYVEILENLKIDIIRKIILEDLLNNNYKDKNKILDEVTFEDIYEKKFKYFSFSETNYNLLKINNISINFYDIQKTIDALNNNNIQYIFEDKEITNLENSIAEIQESYSNGEEFVEFTIENNKIIGQIINKIKFEKEIKYNLIKLQLLDKNLNYNDLRCKEILNNDNYNYTEIKDLEFSSLNNAIKENLKKIDDKMLLNESDKQYIIILCKITYNENFFKNYKINSQVNLIVNNIENDIIEKYSLIFNLNTNYE